MRTFRNATALAAVLALGATPALVLGASHKPTIITIPTGKTITTGKPATTTTTTSTTITPASTATTSLPSTAKAYGRVCQSESKTHVAGTPGTPFSKCVTGMARLATHKTTDPTTACKSESKRHVAGKPGTPFSLCVTAAARLLGTH